MPTTAIIAAGIGAAGAIGGAAISAHGNSQASKTQAGTAAQALDFSKQQEAERKREWDLQQAAAAAQWKAKQDMLRPFNAGAYSVLAKYGIPVSMSGDQGYQPQAMPADYQGGPITPTPKVTQTAVPPVPQQVAQTQPYGSPQASTMGQMMTGTTPVAGAFDWQSPFGKGR